MEIGGKKIPIYLFVLLGSLIILGISVPTLILPYYNELPDKTQKHIDAVAEISKYDTALIGQKKIQAELDDLQKQLDSFNKIMYIDPDAAVAEIQEEVFTKFAISNRLESFARSDETDSKLVTKEGKNFYSVDITIKLTTTRDKILDLLKYIETDAGAYYYVKSVNSNTVEETLYNKQGKVIAEKGDLATTVSATLYYLKEEVQTTTTQQATTQAATK